jgi:hypothetical protein
MSSHSPTVDGSSIHQMDTEELKAAVQHNWQDLRACALELKARRHLVAILDADCGVVVVDHNTTLAIEAY